MFRLRSFLMSCAFLAACGDQDPVTSSRIPIGDGEPAFSVSAHVLLLDETFDSYGSFQDAIAGGWLGINGSSSQDFSTNSQGSNRILTPGREGTGRAIRLVYDGVANAAGQEAHAWGRRLSDTLAGKPGTAFYISYDFRINPGGGFLLDTVSGKIVKVKWLELWNRTEGDRAQFNTSYSHCTNDVPWLGASGGGTLWEFFGRGAGGTRCQATQARPPFAYRGSGQWHRATHRYMTQSGAGARDGVAQMWYDGILIVSVAAEFCGKSVPGAPSTTTQTWCETDDLDEMFVQDYVRRLTFGSVQTAGLWPFALDFDNVKIWRDR